MSNSSEISHDVKCPAQTQIEARISIEIRVIRTLISIAAAHGFALDSVYDGEERTLTLNVESALAAATAVDECWLSFTPPGGGKRHCVVLIFGNDGWDVVADASTGPGWDEVISEHDTWLDHAQVEAANSEAQP